MSDPVASAILTVGPVARGVLESSRKWALLLAGAGWLGVASMLGLFGTAFTDSAAGQRPMLLGAAVGGLLSCGAFAVCLGRFARRMRAFVAGDAGSAAQAFRSLRWLWIGMAVAYGLNLLVALAEGVYTLFTR